MIAAGAVFFEGFADDGLDVAAEGAIDRADANGLIKLDHASGFRHGAIDHREREATGEKLE